MRKNDFGFIFICIYALISNIYLLIRYSGRWIEGDSSRMIRSAQAVQSQATIIPTKFAYPNGPGHSMISTALSELSGVSIPMLSMYILPLFGAIVVMIAYIAFLELTGSKKIALLSAFLLSLQSDFLFTVFRNTHEKFTYSMILLSIFFLSRSFSKRTNVKEFVYYIFLFYVTVLGMISYNFFFAATYIFAVTVTFALGYLISDLPHQSLSFRRLTYTAATSFTFFFSYMFYLYAPSMNLFHLFDSLTDKIGAIALATELHVTPQYTYIFQTWISFRIWLVLTLFNWVIAPLSLAAWIYFVYKFLIKKQKISQPMLLLLMFYAAFSIQLLITIFVDRFGVFNNLELRVFPVLMFFAIPLASISIIKILEFQGLREGQSRAIKSLFMILILIFVTGSLLKATNDPLVSSKWLFYSGQEKEAIFWIERNIPGEAVWAGLDARIIYLFNTYSKLERHDSIKFIGLEKARYWFISDIVETRAQRIRYPLPAVLKKPIIYDSGSVKIYEGRTL